jgi:DNA-binding SARP family transcriptional activator
MSTPRLAKLTRPRTEGLLRRERLFGQLDEARARPVVWIAAPPGAGKTSLLASYLDARKLPGIWYQVDAGDADPATFFYYLGIAAGAFIGRKGKPLPRFTPEVAADVAAFARRYFRELFALLPEDASLVLDNYQEAPERAQFHAVMQTAFEEVPAGICVFCLSRTAVPPELSRLRVAQQLSVLDYDVLRLRADEAAQIAKGHLALDDATLDVLLEQTNGWAAGLVLMVERLRQTGQVHHPTSSTNLEMVFDYFAGQIVHALPESTQDMLLRMSYLPRLTAETAQAITGDPEAVKLLSYLARRNLFTDRRYGEDTSFQFHALFRAFLQEQARNRLGASEHKKAAHSAAALLQATGQVEDAFPLFAETAAWESAAALIRKEAERLVRHGRRQTLRQWITALPMERVEEDAWLLYWLGICTLGANQERAREILASAFERFNTEDDLEGQLASSASAAESFFSMRLGWVGLDLWIERMADILLDKGDAVSDRMRVKATITLARCMFYRQSERKELPGLIETLRGYVDEDLDADERVAAAAIVVGQHLLHGGEAVCESVIRSVAPLLDAQEVTPASRSFLLFWLINHRLAQGDLAEAAVLVERAKSVSDELGLSPMSVEFERMGTGTHILRGDFAIARSILQTRVAPFLADARPVAKLFYHMHVGICDLGEGLVPQAREHIQGALDMAARFGYLLAELAIYPLLGLLLTYERRYDEAERVLVEHRNRRLLGGNRRYASLCSAYLAYNLVQRGETQRAIAELRDAFGELEGGTYLWPQISAALIFDLFPFALEHGIATDFVRAAIRRRGLRCSQLDNQHWPWPLQVRALNAFQVRHDDDALPGGAKPQHRLLDLLKALVACGREGASTQDLADALWPDSEGDSAQNTLQVSLYRLRKMLGCEDAIQVQDGKVRINREVCWVDAWAFEDKAERLKALQPDDAQYEPLAQQSIELYRGHLLIKEKEQPWMLAPRERLRRQWLWVVKGLGERCEQQGQWARACELYQRALDIDALAEEIYRRLMACQREMGERTEALGTYQRCRQQLDAALGVRPSVETERVYKSLLS